VRDHDHVVAVQVHRVHVAAVVVDVHDRDVPLVDREHRHVGVEVSVDRPPQTGPTPDETRPLADGVLEVPAGSSRVETQRCG